MNDNHEDFIDSLIATTARIGIDIGESDKSSIAHPVGGHWLHTTLSEHDYSMLKDAVSQFITDYLYTTFSSDTTFQKHSNLRLTIKRTEDIYYGVRFFFQGTGNRNELDLMFKNLVGNIQLRMQSDVRHSFVSNQYPDCIVVLFHKPVHLELIAFVSRILIMALILYILYQITIWCYGVSEYYALPEEETKNLE